MALLILDASVVIKWFREEIHTDAALRIKQDFVLGKNEIIVPDLILYEITNAMKYSKGFNESIIKESLKGLTGMGMNFILPSEEMIERSVELAYRFDLSVYDAVYVALAELNKGIFITADNKLYDKISKLKFVKFVSSYQ